MTSLARIDVVTSGWTGGPGLSSHFFRGAGGTPSDAEADDALARVRAFWFGLRSLMPPAWTAAVSPTVPIINADDGVIQSVKTRPAPALVVGSAATGFGPPNLAAVIRWQTATVFNGRTVRGRTFWGPLNAGSVNATNPPAALATALGTAQLNMFTGGTSCALVIWHRPKGLTPGNYADVIAPATLGPNWAQLKSRRD